MISWRMVVNQYTLFCLLAVVLVIGAGYSMRKYGDMRFTQGVELTERKHQLATLERDKAERAKEKLAQDKVDELERRYEDERAKTAVIVAGLRDNADSLRNKADRLASQLREATRTTSGIDAEVAANGWTLFGRCTKEYVGMAGIADEQRNDLAAWQQYGKVITQ